MRNKKLNYLLLGGIYLILSTIQSCQSSNELQADLDDPKSKIQLLETATQLLNASMKSLQALLNNGIIVGVKEITSGYQIELSDGQVLNACNSEAINALLPRVSINKDGYWIYSTDEGTAYQQILDKGGKAISAYPIEGKSAASPMFRVDKDEYWQVSCDEGATYQQLKDSHNNPMKATQAGSSLTSIFKSVLYDAASQKLKIALTTNDKEFTFPVINTFYLKIKDAEKEQVFSLNEKRIYSIEQSDVEQATIKAPQGWEVKLEKETLTVVSPTKNDVERKDVINIQITSKKNYIRNISIQVKLLTSPYDALACKTWNDFVAQTTDNKLLDFSYAGYKHGEISPPDITFSSASTAMVGTESYTVYNMKSYGAIPNDGLSDRAAFKAIVKVIHDKYGNKEWIGSPNAKAVIFFPAGEYILHTAEDNVYNADASSPDKKVTETLKMIMGDVILKGEGRGKTFIKMDAPSIPIKASDMSSCAPLIQFTHSSNAIMDAATSMPITQDAPKGSHTITVSNASSFAIGEWVCLRLQNNNSEVVASELAPYAVEAGMEHLKKGVQVWDYQQIRNISGNVVTLTAPLMRGVLASEGWKICKYPHQENIGVEDITFVGKANPKFTHHGSAELDSGYTPLNFNRSANLWMRRVGFTSVSAAASFSACANASVYDVVIEGNRGHSAVTAQGSSRVFIGKVTDLSGSGVGQLHACGIAQHSLGTVVWNVEWGTDACFESHGSQPRATLIDRCHGGFKFNHQGGALASLPNHLTDLTLWNFNAKVSDFKANFNWWNADGDIWWRFMPPTIVGFHGATATFNPAHVRLDADHGKAVYPNSLYEAQLRKRLGYIPAWLNALQ